MAGDRKDETVGKEPDPRLEELDQENSTLQGRDYESRTLPTAEEKASMPKPPENLQDQLVEQIIANLRKVYDPELNLNVYDLGLIYEVAVNKEYDAQIIFTLTTPNCPAAEIIPMEIEFATRAVECVNKVNVVLTFDPPWNPHTMVSDEGKYQLGLL